MFLALASGCGGGRTAPRPVASLAFTTAAAIDFAPIRDAWANASKPGARAQLVLPLASFIAKFPGDGLLPLARAELAIAKLDAGDLAGADALFAELASVPPGATHDLVDIGRARAFRLRKQPELAFEQLRPLVGKVVDASARALLQEEVSLSAIDAHRDYEALAYMDAWLRNSGEQEHDAVHAKVASALATVPESVLENTLRVMRSGGAASGYGREIQRLVTDRLGAIALARGDSDLARWLVSGDASGVTLGLEEGELGELATTHRGLASVDGRTIGLVLPTGSTDLRDEAAAVMRGVAIALELPRASPTLGDQTKLVTRDDGGDAERVEGAMSELAGEGASVIVGALEPRAADRAVKWGEEHGVAVITLAAPSAVTTRDWVFSLGVPRDAEIAALGEELVSRAVTKIVPIVPPGGDAVEALTRGSVQLEPPVACDTAAAQSGEAHFPIADWKREHARAWLVDAPSECARDLIRELHASNASGLIALTLDAAGTVERAPELHLLAVRAGAIPVLESKPEAVTDLAIRAYFAREGSPPNAWAALGRDAAVLARRAVAPLPLAQTSDPARVKALRTQARDGLAVARAPLWTTKSQGFGGARVLPRELEVVEIPSGEKRAPR